MKNRQILIRIISVMIAFVLAYTPAMDVVAASDENPLIEDITDETDYVDPVSEDADAVLPDSSEDVPSIPDNTGAFAGTGLDPSVEDVFCVGPAYKGIYTEEDIRDYIENEYSDDDPYVSYGYGLSEIEPLGSAGSDLKRVMQARKTSFSYSSASFNPEAVIKEAVRDTDETDPLSGDYLRGNLIGWSASGRSSGGAYTINLKLIYTSYNNAAEEEKQVDRKVEEIKTELGLNGTGLSDYEKVERIFKYLRKNITYVDDGKYGCHGTYAALIKNKCVCQGYANAFTRLTREAGVASKYIIDDGSINHAWNIVKVTGGTDPGRPWYNIDVTYGWFIRNELDFHDHPRKDEFLTDEYLKAHPISRFNWGETNAGLLERVNPGYEFTCTDGSKLSSTVHNKPKILIFFDADDYRIQGTWGKNYSCTSTYKVLRKFAESDLVKKNKADVYAIACNGADSMVNTIMHDVNSPKMKFSYASEANFKAYGSIVNPKSSYVFYCSSPTIVLIDENDKIQFVYEYSDLSPDDIYRIHMYYLKEYWDPTADAKSVTLKKYLSAEDLAADKYSTVKNKSTIKLKFGEEIYLRGVAVPNKDGIKDFTDKTTITVSGTEGVIEYDQDTGRVRAIGKGTATITCSSDYNDDVKTEVKITVSPSPIKSIALDKNTASLQCGGADELTVIYTPAVTTDDMTAVFSSSDEKVVRVESTGVSTAKVTAVNPGTAVITARCMKKTATCRITTYRSIEGINIVPVSHTGDRIYVGEQVMLTAIATPLHSDIIGKVSWASSDPDILSVEPSDDNNYCYANALKPGNAKISVTADGYTAALDLKVLSSEMRMNAGTGKLPPGTDDVLKVKCGLKIGNVPLPVYEGHIFMGWFTKPECGGVKIDPDTIAGRSIYNDEMTLYAGWKSTYPDEITICPVADCVYNGAARKPSVDVYFGDKLLTPGKDYSVSYKNNKNAFTLSETDPGYRNAKGVITAPSIIVKGKKPYVFNETAYFRILPKDISGTDVTVNFAKLSLTENGKVQKAVPVLKYGKITLKNRADFSLDYDDGSDGAYIKPGRYSVKITATGKNYTGQKVIYETIVRKDLINISKCKVSVDKNVYYDGVPCIPNVVVRSGKTVLTEGKDYLLGFRNNDKPGNATVVICGIGGATGTKTLTFKIKSR